jgi:RND family efflux transporter MFP subunit
MDALNRDHGFRTAAPLLAMALTLAACGGEGPPPLQAPAVTVTQPTRSDVQTFGEFTGTTRATEYAEIRARISGQLREMYFAPSSYVNRGDVLFLIEPEPYKASYDEAVASVASAESELSRSQSDLERIQLAIQSNAVSQQDLDRALATRDQANAALLAARARLDQAVINLDYTSVETPVTGQVSRNFVDLGNLVGAGEPTLLTTVTRVSPIWVYFNVPEREVLSLLQARADSAQGGLGEDERVGVVHVETANETGRFPHRGEIDFINNTVDPNTGTIELRAILPNDDLILFPGLFVRIRVLGPVRYDAILVEERAIGTDLGGKYVLVLGEDNIVEQRYVTLGPIQDDGTVVVEEGLDGTEDYVVNGMLRARPGFPVTPETVVQAAATQTRQPTIGPADEGDTATSGEGS